MALTLKTVQMPGETRTDRVDDLIDIGALVEAIWRARVWIAGTVLACACLGFVYASFIATPLYKATAAVVITGTDDSRAQLSSGLSSLADLAGINTDGTSLTTQIHVLKARDLHGKVVDRLNLMEDPDFNPVLADPDKFAHLDNPRARDRTIKTLGDAIVIQNLQNTLVFNITVTTTDPSKSAMIANALAEEYVADQIASKFTAAEKATAWLSERAAELKQDLDATQARVTAFTTERALITPGELMQEQRQLQDLRDRILEAEQTFAALTLRRDRLLTARGEGVEAQMATAQDARLTALGRPIIGADTTTPTQEAAFETRYDNILADVEQDLIRMQRQLATLRDTDADVRDRIASRSQDLIALQDLQREAEATRVLYETFLTRLKESTAQQGTQSPDSRVLNRAIEPFEAASPQKTLIMVMTSILGLLVSAGIALLRGTGPGGFRTSTEIEAATGMPVLGRLPELQHREGRAPWARATPVTRNALVSYLAQHPTTPAAEAARNLQTALVGRDADRPPRTILVTSSIPDEGKSTLAVILARSLAKSGKSVLLYEGDVRRHVFAAFFPETAHKASAQAPIQREPDLGCDIRFADQTALNPDRPFDPDAFAADIRALRTQYDHIVVDAPPVLPVTDAQLMAPECDALLFALRWSATPRADVAEALRILDRLDIAVSGIALTQIAPRSLGLQRYDGYFAPGDVQPVR